MQSAAKLEKNMSSGKSFGMGDKVGYMLGDFGNSLLFNFIGSYLLVFYTDAFGISAAAVGTLMMVSRIWDAINDPMMGVIVDKRKAGKNGKFRPYIKYAGLPLGIFTILTFLVIPNMPENMKLPYAYITYIGFGMAYTAINIPYGSLASVMTSDPVERTSLSTFRNLGSTFSMILLMGLTPKLIFEADNSVSVKGFLIAAVIYAIVANVCYQLTYKMTTERVVHEVKENEVEKASLMETIKYLVKNKALIGLIVASLGTLTAMFLPNALNTYLFKDYFQAPGLLGLAGMVGMLAIFVALPLTTKLVSKFGKKNVAAYTLIISIVAYGIMVFVPNKNPMVYIALTTVSGIGTAFFNMLIWALVGDTIDYQEYITGKREEGTVYAAYSLARKLVQAIVGSVGGFALAAIGYQSGVATQTAEVAESIRMIITAIPFAGLIIGFLAMKFIYNLNDKKLEEIEAELKRRRA